MILDMIQGQGFGLKPWHIAQNAGISSNRDDHLR